MLGRNFNLAWRYAETSPRRLWASIMNRIEEISTVQAEQLWLEPFLQLLDEIYFPGYAQKLAEENPKEFNLQWWYFLEAYN